MSRELTVADVGGEEKKEKFESFRCWDGAFGCNQVKPVGAFYNQRKGGRAQPTLCDDCLNHKAVSFGVSMAHVEILMQLLHQEISLFKQARALAKPADITDKLMVMKEGIPERMRNLVPAVVQAFKTHFARGVEKVNAEYHRYWFSQLGMEMKPNPTEFKQIVQAAVPVGDR